MYVLEDNLRVPSGVSYMLENRQVTKRVFADLFRDLDIQPVDDYSNKLAGLLAALSPRPGETPVIAVLTPGIFNSAYFEHAFLAQQMGAHLVEGKDLVVDGDDCVYMRTIGGLVRVDVIYRRVDDLFLDPEVFRPDSTVGVPGLMRAWRAGNVATRQRAGAGVADDKVVYAYVPALIRYYLDEDPAIPNVPTWLCHHDRDRRHVLSHLDEMVVKPANESGGYGVFVGSTATRSLRTRCGGGSRPILATTSPSRSCAFPPPRRCVTAGSCPGTSTCGPSSSPASSPTSPQGGLTRVALKTGISCRQQLPGRGQQGHLGHRPDRRAGHRVSRSRDPGGHACCCHGSPSRSTGPGGTSSGPRPRPGSCTSTPSSSWTCRRQLASVGRRCWR